MSNCELWIADCAMSIVVRLAGEATVSSGSSWNQPSNVERTTSNGQRIADNG